MTDIQPTLKAIDEAIDDYVTWNGSHDAMEWYADSSATQFGPFVEGGPVLAPDSTPRWYVFGLNGWAEAATARAVVRHRVCFYGDQAAFNEAVAADTEADAAEADDSATVSWFRRLLSRRRRTR